jgi:hypothetical protein
MQAPPVFFQKLIEGDRAASAVLISNFARRLNAVPFRFDAIKPKAP